MAARLWTTERGWLPDWVRDDAQVITKLQAYAAGKGQTVREAGGHWGCPAVPQVSVASVKSRMTPRQSWHL